MRRERGNQSSPNTALAVQSIDSPRELETAKARTSQKMSERSKFQRAILEEHYPPPHLFAVVSWGCAATSWLGKVLNSHPEIYCVHAGNFFWRCLANAPAIDGLEYLQVIGSQGSTATAAGDVHGVSRHTIKEISDELAEGFGAAIVIREPLPRLLSQMALFDKLAKFRIWEIEYIDHVIRELDLDLPDETYETKLFVHGVVMLNAIIEECEIADVFRSEDLTSSATHLVDFVNKITRSKVETTHAWAEACLRMRKVNVHQGRLSKTIPFQDWQLKIINNVVLPESWRLYEEYGYQTPEFVRTECSSGLQSALP